MVAIDASTQVSVLGELAEDWLATKRAVSIASNVAAADRARRNDLCRWGRALSAIGTGPDAVDRPGGRFDLDADFGCHRIDELTSERLGRALGHMRSNYTAGTCRRSVATMRTFCRWLVRRGHLGADPTDIDELTVVDTPDPDDSPIGFYAFDTDEVAAMIDAAANPSTTTRAVWPARDVAALSILEGCGLRVAELCGLRDLDVADRADNPVVHVVIGAKRSKRRTVPLPGRTVDAVRAWRSERDDQLGSRADNARLLVRPDGTNLNQPFVDRLIRRVAAQSGVVMRGDAAAHGFRHHYGTALALRGVPVPVIAEAMGHADTRTTSIYTRAVGRHLTDALDDAGWL